MTLLLNFIISAVGIGGLGLVCYWAGWADCERAYRERVE